MQRPDTLAPAMQSGTTPVLCLAFNRPDLFANAVEAVRAAGPRDLFVSIDGPRPGNSDDERLCAEVRQLAEKLDWQGTVRIKAEEQNLGLGPGVSSAITWALGEHPEVIVLEDDLVPDPSFFAYCDELLDRYRDDERVMHICGTNWGTPRERFAGSSYAFTNFAPTLGWATWRRAWDLYDFKLESWPQVKASGVGEGFGVPPRFRRLLHRDWDLVHAGGGNWDYQWHYTVMRHHGLAAIPECNLIRHLGARPDATNFQGEDRFLDLLPLESLGFPLRHPAEVAPNARVEATFDRTYWQKRGWPGAVFRRVVREPRLNAAIRALVRRPAGR